MWTVRVQAPDGEKHQTVCSSLDDCLELVRVEVATAKPWTLIHMTSGTKTVATWGVGPHGRVARKPIQRRTATVNRASVRRGK